MIAEKFPEQETLLQQLSLCSVSANTHLNAKWLFSSTMFTTLMIFYLWVFIQTGFLFTQMLAEGLFFIWIPALRKKQGYSLRAKTIATCCYLLVLTHLFQNLPSCILWNNIWKLDGQSHPKPKCQWILALLLQLSNISWPALFTRVEQLKIRNYSTR